MTPDAAPMTSPLLYKYVSIAGLRRILTGSIRFTQPSAFNDPFELLPEIIVPSDAQERPIRVSFDILAERGVTPEAEAAIPDGCGCSDAMSRDIVQQLNQLIGILSLSRTRNSLLMWSHYADQYAGAVVRLTAPMTSFRGRSISNIDPRGLGDVYSPISQGRLFQWPSCARSPTNGPTSARSG